MNSSNWLIEKQKSGYGMLNSTAPLAEMKLFLRGAHHEPANFAAFLIGFRRRLGLRVSPHGATAGAIAHPR